MPRTSAARTLFPLQGTRLVRHLTAPEMQSILDAPYPSEQTHLLVGFWLWWTIAMSGAAVVVDRRSRVEIARLAGLYGTSGMGRSEFCGRHGLALSTLNRPLKKKQQRNHAGNDGGRGCALVEVELSAAVVPGTDRDQAGALTVMLQNGRSVSVGCDFDSETLRRLVAVLEQL